MENTLQYAREQIKFWEDKYREAELEEAQVQRKARREKLLDDVKNLIKQPPTVVSGEIVDMMALGRMVCNSEYDDVIESVLKKLPLDCMVEVTIKIIGPIDS